MLRFIHKHRFGILGTILFHVLVVLWANYAEMPVHEITEEHVLVVDFPEEEELTPEEQEQMEKQTQTEAESNKAVNEAAPENVQKGDYNEYNREPSPQSKESFEKQLEQELKDLERQVIEEQRDKGYGYTEEEISEMLSSKKNKELDQVKEQKPRSEAAYQGSTNITYKLANRYDTRLDVPVYVCQYGGTVVVNIAVDQNGDVVDAKIDKESSKTTDSCLLNAALKGAKRTKFNRKSNAPKIQTGSITYQFIAQ